MYSFSMGAGSAHYFILSYKDATTFSIIQPYCKTAYLMIPMRNISHLLNFSLWNHAYMLLFTSVLDFKLRRQISFLFLSITTAHFGNRFSFCTLKLMHLRQFKSL